MVNFTEEQMAFIEAPIERNICLLATAGTGKTTATVARYQYMVDQGVRPDQIAAIAFNKKMADELKDRILRALPDLSTDAQNQISTIHAFCFRLLSKYEKNKMYTMPKPWEEARLVQESIDKFWIGKKPTTAEVLNYISTAKYEAVEEKFLESFFSKRMDSYLASCLANVMMYYDAEMRAKNWISFPDMLLKVERLLESDSKFLEFARERTPYILIDEAQDVNAQALRIFLKIGTTIIMVGDPDQMMYRFAGANPDIMMKEFIEKRSPIVLKLTKNWRSTATIVALQKQIIEENYSHLGGPYDVALMKEINAASGELGEDVVFCEYEDPFQEAEGIVTTILELLEMGFREDEIFIGTRTKAQLGYLESPLVRNNLPFINLCGGSFWGQSHIQHVVNYIKLSLDTSNNEAYRSVANIASNNHVHTWGEKAGEYCGVRFLGAEFFKKCPRFDDIEDFLNYDREAWRYKTKDYFDKKLGFTPYDEYGPSKAEDLVLYVREIQEYVGNFSDNPSSVVQYVIDTCYHKYLIEHEGALELEDSRLEDLETLVNFSNQHDDLESFLRAVDEMVEKSKADTWDDHVVISTIHRLKGQERGIMFLPGASEGDDENGPCGLLPHTYSLRPVPQFGVLPPGSGNPLEDERCICFVGVSRAKARLYISSVKTYNGKVLHPSRFVSNLFA